MASTDPSARVRFTLARGAVETADRDRLVLLPASVLSALAREAGAAAVACLGRELGAAVGARIAGVAATAAARPFDEVLDALALELALAGLGVVSVERWGRALVLVVTDAPLPHARFLEEVLGGALAALADADVAGAFVGFEGDRLRFFVGRPETASRVRAEVERAPLGEVLERLQRGSAR